MLRRVAVVRTGASEESSASIIRVTRIGELGTMLAVTSNGRTPSDGQALSGDFTFRDRSSISGYSVWDLWWTACQRGMIFCHTVLSLQPSFRLRSIIIIILKALAKGGCKTTAANEQDPQQLAMRT
jgi:hypothetical protein